MIEKNILISSPDDSLNAVATIVRQNDYTDVELKGNISFILSPREVLKAYAVNEDGSKINIGVVKADFSSINARKRIYTINSIPKEIRITRKNTDTEEEKIIAGGSCSDDNQTDTEAAAGFKNTPDTLKRTEALLTEIKNASETNDRGISKRNCIDIIKQRLEGKKKLDHTFRMFDTFYISQDFFPIAELSSLKFVMSGGLCTYSFFEKGHYYISLKENFILIAFGEYNGQNPMYHIKDFSSPIKITDEIYYGVIIELADEGQYFVT